MAKRVQPQTNPGTSEYDYGYNPTQGGGGARRVQNTGGFGPDANAIRDTGQSMFSKMYERIRDADEKERKDDQPATMEANPVDRFMSDLYDLGEKATPKFLRDMQQSDNIVEKAAGVVLGAPFGTLGAIPQGLAQGYEAIWGRGVTGDDQDRDTVERLDANERTASGVNALINVGGAGFGGSGRMLKGGGRAIKTLLGDAAETGVKRAVSNAAKDTATGFIRGGGWKDVVGDMAEEAGEEFVQSLADDARYGTADEGSIGRALESAAWGALGGGAMSGFGYGLNKLTTKIAGPGGNENSSDGDAQTTGQMSPDRYRQEYQTDESARNMTPSARTVAEKRTVGNSLSTAGSNSITLMQNNDPDLGINEAKMGTQDIRAVWNARDNGESQKVLASSLGMTVDDAGAIFSQPDWEDALISRINAIRDEGGKFNMYWARNPATKGKQPVKSDVVDVFKGSGLMLHPSVMPLVGADVDGDLMVVNYSTRDLGNANYATSLLVDPETGDINLDAEAWMRTGLSLSMSQNAIQRSISDALLLHDAPYGARPNKGQKDTRVRVSLDTLMGGGSRRYSKRMSDALAKNDYDSLGRAIVDLFDDIRSHEGDADAVINDVIRNLATNPETNLVNSVSKIMENAARDAEAADVEIDSFEKAPAPGINTQGSVPRNYSIARMLADWNMVTYALTNKGNPIFRQFGVMGYEGKAVPTYTDIIDTFENRFGHFSDPDKYTQMIVSCLKETSQGSSVENSIDSALRSWVIAKTISDTNVSVSKLKTSEQAEAFFNAFIENRNDAARMCGECAKRLTPLGFNMDISMKVWGDIKKGDGPAYKNTRVMSEFVRVLGTVPVDTVFDTANMRSEFNGMSIRELSDAVTSDAIHTGNEFISMGETPNAIINGLRDSNVAMKNMIANKIMEDTRNLSDMFSLFKNKLMNGTLDRNDLITMTYMLDSANWLIGEEQAFDLNLTDPTLLSKSRWGREIISGDPDRCINAIVSASLTGQFRRPLRMFYEAESSAEANQALDELQKLRMISPLHNEIVSQILSNDGQSDLLDLMTDLDQSFESKMAEFKEAYPEQSENLLIMALQNKTSTFEMSDINIRRTNATKSYNTGMKVLDQEARDEVDRITNTMTDISDEMYVAALEEMAMSDIIETDNETLAAMLYDSAFFSGKSLEKATLELAAQSYGISTTVAVDGSVLNLTEKMLDIPLGHVSMDTFTSNPKLILGVLSGRIERLDVYDPRGLKAAKPVTRDTIFLECNPGMQPGTLPNRNQWNNVLRRFPVLIRVMAPKSVDTTIVGGDISAKVAVAQSAESFIRNYSERAASRGESAQEAQFMGEMRRRVRIELRRVPGFPARLLECIPNLHSNMDPRYIYEQTNRLMDSFVDTAVNRVLTTKGGVTDADIRSQQASMIINSAFTDITRIINDALVNHGLNSQTAAVYKTVETDARKNFSNAMYKAMAIKYINDAIDPDATKEEVFDFYSGLDDVDDDLLDNRNIMDELSENSAGAMDIIKVLAEFSDTSGVNQSFKADKECINAVNEFIDRIDNNVLDSKRKADIKNDLKSVGDLLHAEFSKSNSTDGIMFTDVDLNIALSGETEASAIASAMDKARKIWRETGQYGDYDEEYDGRIKQAITGLDENGVPIKDIKGFRRKLKIDLDSMVMDKRIRDMGLISGASVNANMLKAFVEANGVDEQIDAAVRRAMSEWPRFEEGTTKRSLDVGQTSYPVPHVMDPATQAMVSKLNSADVPASMVATNTAFNGTSYQSKAAYAALPRNRVCNVPPRPMSSSELRDMAVLDSKRLRLSDVKVAKPIKGNVFPQDFEYKPEGRGKTWRLASLSEREIQQIMNGTSNRQYLVFLHDDCEHGLCVAHQKKSVGAQSRGYLSVPNIINKINQYSQEAMNLKFKKRANMLVVLGDGWSVEFDISPVTISLDQNGALDPLDISRASMMIRKTRDSITRMLSSYFAQDNMSGLNYGPDQASQLAMVMVQGIEFKFSDDNRVITRIAPKIAVDGDLNAWVAGIVKETGCQPISIEPHIRTLDELSAFGMNYVLDNKTEDMSAKKIEELMYEGMTDLSKVPTEQLTLDEIMGSILPPGVPNPSSIPVSTNPSRKMSLRDALEMQQISSMNTTRAGTVLVPANESIVNAAKDASQMVDISKAYGKYKVYKTFGATRYFNDNADKPADIVRNAARDLMLFDSTDSNQHMQRGLALAFNEQGASAAYVWARDHGEPFAVPYDIFEKNQAIAARYRGYHITSNVIKTDTGAMQVYIIDPSSITAYNDSNDGGKPKSKRNPIPRSYITMNSVPGLSMADAGSFVNKDTVGTIITRNAGLKVDSVEQITGGFVKGPTTLANRADLDLLVKELKNGVRDSINLRKLDNDRWSEPLLKEALDDFIDWYDSSDDDEWHRMDAEPGSIIGFLITKDRSGAVVYSPMTIPRTATRTKLTNVNVNKVGDAVAISYTDETNMADTLRGDGEPKLYAHKIALNGVAYKSMATVIDPGKFALYAGSEMPSVAALFGGKKKNVDIVVDHLALDGRKKDMGKLMMLDNLWYFSKSFTAVNPFVKKTEAGIEFSDFLKRKMQEKPDIYTPELMRSLFSGSGEMWKWKEISDSKISLTGDESLDRLIWNIIDRCADHRIYPMDIFASSHLSPGMVDAMLATGSSAMDLKNTAVDADYRMVLGYLDTPSYMKLFNWIDPNLIASSVDTDGETSTVFNKNGQMYIDFGLDSDNKSVKPAVDVIVGPVYDLGKGSYHGTPSSSSKLSAQARITRGFESGLWNQDPEFFIKYFAMRMGRSDIINDMREKQLFKNDDDSIPSSDLGFSGSIDRFRDLKQVAIDSASQRNYERKLRDTGKSFRWLPLEDKVNNVVYDTPSSLNGVQEVASAMSDLNYALRGIETIDTTKYPKQRNITIDEVMMLYVCGSSYTYNENVGSKQGDFRGFIKFIKEMTENIDGGKIPITVRETAVNSRYATPLIPHDLAASLYEISPTLQRNFTTFADFKEAMFTENKAAIDQFNNIRDKGKRNEIFRLNDWLMLDWGETPATGHIYGRINRRDMMNTNNRFIMSVNKSIFTKEQLEAEKKMSEREDEAYAKLAQYYETEGKKDVGVDIAHNGQIVEFRRNDTSFVGKVLRNASELSRFMAMLDLMIPGANIVDRVVHQGMTNALMQWSMNNGIGPYKSNFVPDANVVNAGADSADAEKVFNMIRYASYDGDEGRILSNIHSMDDVNSYLESRENTLQRSAYRKVVESVFELAGGGKFMQKYQIRNWFRQFSRIISSNEFKAQLGGQTPMYLTKPDGSDMTLLEVQWAQNPAMVLVDVFGNTDNPYHTAALQALSFSREHEAANQNVLYAFYSAAAKRSPAVEFFTTTCVSRFFLYSTNMTGRVLNIILPMTSINHAVVNLMSEYQAGRAEKGKPFGLIDAINFKGMQSHINMLEAIQVDLMHMAPSLVALAIAMIPGVLEPPEDEDKMGNPDEWMFCGARIADNWLISDTIGIALPLAQFFKSAAIGKPRFDLITNGIMQACYNNPMLKASTFVGGLFNPDETFITEIGEDFAEDQEDYSDAPEGSPDFIHWLLGKTWGNTLSWSSQFITPTFIRNALNSYEADRSERAYRYVKATDARGNVIIDPDTQLSEYQKASYWEAQTRRVTRTNPMIGLLMDVATGAWLNGTTGYTRWEMPRSVIYDDAQIECMRLYSVNDENGEPLPADQQQEKIYMVLSVLMANDDMEALCDTGFYLDYDTKRMVGDTIHDIIQTMRDNYSQLQADGFFDYYYGGLDYDSGRERAETLKAQYYDELGYWQDLYYDKLWSEPMRRTLTLYNRYNTRYAQDDNGEWYATGYYNSMFPIIRHAAGTMDDPAGTAGYENDWNSVSVVTGQPMDSRALVPVEAGYLDTPDLDSLGDDSNGGYSPSFPGWKYANSINGDGYDYDDGGWGWRSRGGGGGGRGGRGGGGGGYSPNIYSRLPNVYPGGARTMYAERIYGPNYDYLRPNFETKGSREAYKRSDI